MEKHKIFLVVGQISLALGFIGFLSNHLYLDNNSIIAFCSGLLLGLSFVFNITFLINNRNKS
jgi:vacuolar-type H+-ATPase subunit I/STV1